MFLSTTERVLPLSAAGAEWISGKVSVRQSVDLFAVTGEEVLEREEEVS